MPVVSEMPRASEGEFTFDRSNLLLLSARIEQLRVEAKATEAKPPEPPTQQGELIHGINSKMNRAIALARSGAVTKLLWTAVLYSKLHDALKGGSPITIEPIGHEKRVYKSDPYLDRNFAVQIDHDIPSLEVVEGEVIQDLLTFTRYPEGLHAIEDHLREGRPIKFIPQSGSVGHSPTT